MSSFKIGEGYGATITNDIRELAWFTGTREKGIVELMRSFDGMDIDCAENIIDGKLKLVENVETQECETVDDDWTPPNIVKMKEAIDEFSFDVEFAMGDIGDISIATHFTDYGRLQRAIYQITGLEESFEDWVSSKRFYLSPIDVYRLDIAAKEIQKLAEKNIVKAFNSMQHYLRLHIPQNQAGYINELEPIVLHNFMIHRMGNYDYKEDYAKEIEKIELLMKLQRKLGDISFENNDMKKVKTEYNKIQERILDAKLHGVDIVDDTKTLSNPDGWLSPNGKFFSCEAYEHIYLSWKLCEHLGYEFEDPTADDVMIQHGWVKCSFKNWILSEKSLTQRQINFLFDWCEKYGKNMKMRVNRRLISYQNVVDEYKKGT